MFLKRFLFLFLITGLCYNEVKAQEDDFCDALNTILRDAPNKFRNIRGKLINAGSSATIWACGIKVPGTMTSRFVASMGLFYEGAVFQGKSKTALKVVYDNYKEVVKECFAPEGYTMSLQDNFYPGLSDFKKVVFMPAIKEDGKPGPPPPHITMEATYSKEAGFYTVVIYIFEH